MFFLIHCKCFCGLIKGLKIGAKYGRIYRGGGWKLGRLGSLHCMGLRGGEILYGRFAKKVFERQH